MRHLEIVIILLLFAYHLVFFKINRPAWLLMPGIILLLTLFHLFFEGYRWQMLPVYFLIITLREVIKMNSISI